MNQCAVLSTIMVVCLAVCATATAAVRGGGLRPTMPLPRLVAAPAPTDGVVYDVTDYGAKGDNATDNTAAFTAALTAAASAHGGVVGVPTGLYRFAGSVTVPTGVVLRGTYGVVPSHNMVNHGPPPQDGSILMPSANRGNDSGPAFITVESDALLTGVVVFYPEQTCTGPPVPYPYSVALTGNNAAVTDVELLNAWNGVSAVGAARHYIARVQGQPANIGIFVDKTYDIGRVEDVHWNPWYCNTPEYMRWQTTFGQGFLFGRSDWEYVFNTFVFGMAVGYHFIETSTGAMNGNLLGIGADYACNASVLVDAAQAPGLLFTNGEFTAFSDKSFAPNSTADSTQVVVSDKNTGPVRFVTSSFWGPSDSVARVAGSGLTSFVSCEFVQWDLRYKRGSAAVNVTGGSVILQGNDFQQEGMQVSLGADVAKAVVVGNVVKGALNIAKASSTNAQIGLNAADS